MLTPHAVVAFDPSGSPVYSTIAASLPIALAMAAALHLDGAEQVEIRELRPGRAPSFQSLQLSGAEA